MSQISITMTYIIHLFCVLSIIFEFTLCYNINPGPVVIATKGEVWPKPQTQKKFNEFLIVRPSEFKFQAIGESCNILQEAIERYSNLIRNNLKSHKRHRKGHKKIRDNTLPISYSWNEDPNFIGYLDHLDVLLTQPCDNNDVPNVNMNENYTLNINYTTTQLKSNSIWGIIRGLETFSQLLFLPEIGATELKINKTSINDFPRFHHRGLLLDTSRHYMPMSIILQILDGMAYNKLNVFHWHVVDDHSFPYESINFPELSAKGAYYKTLVYNQKDVQKIISYAAKRGIRVMAEFDTPGHTRSWGEGHPEILTKCYSRGKPNGYLGPIDPTKNTTYTFMQTLLKEVGEVFPDEYVHLGGDEVDFDCWQSNPDIDEWMEENNMVDDYAELEEYYIQKIVDMVDALNSSSVVWHEVFENGVRLPKSSIIHVWLENDILPKATSQGYRTLWSSCWYLDDIEPGGDWQKFYKCDPYTHFILSPKQKKLVLGGEACMWAESVDATNVVQRIFPRASAIAEKLWSAVTVVDIPDASRRLEEHACRMNFRGIPAQPPNGPGFCVF